jgi:hypothetical protein
MRSAKNAVCLGTELEIALYTVKLEAEMHNFTCCIIYRMLSVNANYCLGNMTSPFASERRPSKPAA